jgi:gliding motility-associated protein GldL
MAKKVGGFKKVIAMAYGIGAAIVILGALFKIMHWPYAAEMLIAGMGTEVLIFLVSAFDPVYEEYQWERVYPELFDESEIAISKTGGSASGGGMIGSGSSVGMIGGNANGGSEAGLVAALDSALSKANLDSGVIERLGENLGKLSTNIESMNSVADVANSTHSYSEAAKNAADSLNTLKTTFQESAEAAKSLALATNGTQEYQEQISLITKNLQQLNSIYQIELQDANNHLKNLNKFVGNLSEAMSSLESTKNDAQMLKDNMGNLSNSLNSLNSIYGGILSAMRTA